MNQVVKCLEPIIKDFPFVENYGGLVQVVSKTEVLDNGVTKKITFPVTCNATATCLNNSGYSPIIPGQCNSIFYFEGSDLRPRGCEGAKGKTYVWTGTLTLVGWVNLRKLGVAICGDCSAIIACIMTSGIIGKCKLGPPYNNGSVEIGLPNIRKNDYKIFSKYSYYSKLKDKLIYPYQFFALDFPVTIKIPEGCIDAEICAPDPDQEPIICKVV